MRIKFAETDRQKVLAAIQTTMGDRKLGDMVSFKLVAGGLDVVISKMGTSTISFKEKMMDDGIEYTLANEKIAFTHKPFKDEVTQKIAKVIQSSGGKVTA